MRFSQRRIDLAVDAATAEGVLPTEVIGATHVAQKPAGLVTVLRQQGGQGGDVIGQLVTVLEGPVATGIEPGQHGGQRRPGDGAGRDRGREVGSRSQQGVDAWTGRDPLHRVPVNSQTVGAQRVDGDENDMSAGRGAGQAALACRILRGGAAGRSQRQCHKHRQVSVSSRAHRRLHCGGCSRPSRSSLGAGRPSR
jgi:hypothetical protein